LFWLLYSNLNKEDKGYCYFHELNKEFGKIGNNKYNFYDFVITNKKICIEFNGDYWHANPKIYKPNDDVIYPEGKIYKAKDLWYNDKIKNMIMENVGYKVYIVWQRDFVLDENGVVDNIMEKIYGSNKNR